MAFIILFWAFLIINEPYVCSYYLIDGIVFVSLQILQFILLFKNLFEIGFIIHVLKVSIRKLKFVY